MGAFAPDLGVNGAAKAKEMGAPRAVVRFGDFEADLQAGSLTRQGVKVRLRQQLFTALAMLLEHGGEVVTREELQRRLWPEGVFVDFEIDLNTVIARLREALGDSAENPRFIETLPKRGYRFLVAPAMGVTSEPFPRRPAKIVVLPFSNAAGDPAEEYLSDTMTDEVITALCRVAPENLSVIARTTAMHYKNSAKDIAHIGRELGVDYVVEGAVRRDGGRAALNIQLIQASDQTHVFAEKRDAEMSDLFGLETLVAEDIASHIPSVPRAQPGRGPRKKPTEDGQAYELYLQGRYHMYKMTPDSLAKARQRFEAALARDPQFALAYDGLGEHYWYIGFYGWAPPRQASFSGLGAVLRAVEIDPTLAETHSLLGQFRQKVDYNWAEVRREMMLALELDPLSPLARLRYAISDLLPHGQLDEAVAQVERGLEFDPMGWLNHVWLATFLWLKRDYERGLRVARFSADLNPGNFTSQYIIGNILRDGGKPEEAISYQRRAVELSGGAPQMLGWLGLGMARIGDPAGAREVLERLRSISSKVYVSPTSFVWVYVSLGEFDEALTWIGRAIDDRDSFIIPIKTYQCLDPLRSDQRFQALVRRMNLEP